VAGLRTGGNLGSTPGHTKADTNTGYTHHELEILRAAVGKIPGLK